MREQLPDPLREQRLAAGRDKDAGRPVDDGVHVAADGRGDDRGAAGHRRHGHDPRRLVVADADEQVGGAQQRRQRAPAQLAGEQHPAAEAEGAGEPGEPAVGRVRGEPLARRSARDHQLGARHPGQRPQQRPQRAFLVKVGHGHQARAGRPPGDGAFRGELVGVHAARDDLDRPARHPEPGQVRLLGRAPGDHGADAAPDRGFKPDAFRADVMRHDPVPPLGDAERAERLHHGDAQVSRGGKGREAARPAQRVHHVGPLAAPSRTQPVGELRHPREQLRLIHGSGRADVLDPHAGARPRARRGRGAVALGEHGHPVARGGQALAQLTQPDVLVSLRDAVAGERRRVLRYQGDLHRRPPHRG